MRDFKIKMLMILVALFVASKVHAYKVELHSLLTEAAARQSVLANDDIWQEWGYSGPIVLDVPAHVPESRVNWVGWQDENGVINEAFEFSRLMSFGADVEDTGLHVFISRAFNHFYNPQKNQKLPYVESFQDNHTSPDWILEDRGQIEEQQFSYADAQHHFFNAFAAQTAELRRQELGLAIYTLGHIVHHIQDMAQPQHTRLDMHCDADICKFWNDRISQNDDTSAYEVFTENLRRCDAYVTNFVEEKRICKKEIFDEWMSSWTISPINISAYPPVEGYSLLGTYNITPRDFWSNTRGTGLADFSSTNFITTDTPFSYSSSNCPAGGCASFIDFLGPYNTDFPFPDGKPLTDKYGGRYTETYIGEKKPLSELVLNTDDFSDFFLNAKVQFIGYRFFDNINGNQIDNTRMASYSIFQERLDKIYSSSNRAARPIHVLSTNYFNLQKQAEILLPRAVGYSAGLINFFFRYRFKISENRHFQQLSTWSVKNLSEYPFNGEIVFYYDDINGVRHPVPTQPGKVSIMPGKSIDIGALVVPPSAKPSQNFYAVAVEHRDNRALALGGVKFTNINRNAKEPEPCDKTIEVAGGSETIRTLINLGESNGVVKITYNMFNIPDSIYIAKLDGTSLYTTWSPVSGSSTISIDYDSSQFPQQAIYLTIVGNRDQGTQWTVRASCPR